MDSKDAGFNLNDKLMFLQDLLFYNNQIYLWKFSIDQELIFCNCPHKNIFKNYLFLDMPDTIFPNLEFEKINIFSGSLGLFWALIPFTEQEQDCLYVLGPVFYHEINEKTFKRRMDIKQMAISSQLKLLKLLNEIPVVSSSNFQGFAGMLYFTLFQREAFNNDIHLLFTNHSIPEDKYEITTHGTYAWEQHFLQCVEDGNLNYKEEMGFLYSHLTSNQVAGVLSTDPIRQAKNQAIIATALVMRAAVRGGLNSELAYSLSDYYIQHAEACTSEMETQQLTSQMYDSFIHKVHEARLEAPLSSVVEQCRAIIIQNLGQHIELKEIAQTLGFTPYYLSSVFKKETGKTINAYITEQKIERAKYLLSSTTLSILDISNELAFSSPSYFSQQFRKIVGQTPQQFRKMPDVALQMSSDGEFILSLEIAMVQRFGDGKTFS